jgi:hypothetical protein
MNNSETGQKCQLKEIEENLRGSLNVWSDILLDLQVKGFNSDFKFNNKDMMNLLVIFQEVAHNLAFFQNPLDKKQSCARATYFGEQVRDMMINFCGFDPHEEIKN